MVYEFLELLLIHESPVISVMFFDSIATGLCL